MGGTKGVFFAPVDRVLLSHTWCLYGRRWGPAHFHAFCRSCGWGRATLGFCMEGGATRSSSSFPRSTRVRATLGFCMMVRPAHFHAFCRSCGWGRATLGFCMEGGATRSSSSFPRPTRVRATLGFVWRAARRLKSTGCTTRQPVAEGKVRAEQGVASASSASGAAMLYEPTLSLAGCQPRR